MATATTIITRALKYLNVVGKGMAADASDLEDGLTELNAYIDELRTQRLAIVSNKKETFTLGAGTGSYTIGIGGDFNTTRPVAIDKVYVTVSNTNRVLTEMDAQAYYGIPLPTASGSPPEYFYYEPTVPLGTIKFFPVPSASATVALITLSDVSSFATIDDDIDLAPSYENLLVTGLAIRMAPITNQEPSQTLVRLHMNCMKTLKRQNRQDIHTNNEFARSRRRINIITGP